VSRPPLTPQELADATGDYAAIGARPEPADSSASLLWYEWLAIAAMLLIWGGTIYAIGRL
jgi:hypothetical protein